MTLKQLKKQLNPAAQKFGLYSAYALDESEHIGSIPFERAMELEDNGYETPPTVGGIQLTAAKLHPETGQVHDATFRKVDSDNPRWQWHIHLWDCMCMGYFEIFSHYEMRPDFERIDGEDTAEMLGRLQIHYRPEYNQEYYPGRADPVVQDLVND